METNETPRHLQKEALCAPISIQLKDPLPNNKPNYGYPYISHHTIHHMHTQAFFGGLCHQPEQWATHWTVSVPREGGVYLTGGTGHVPQRWGVYIV